MPARIALALAALLLAFPAAAQQFPPLSGRVVDAAGLLSPATEAAMTARLEQLENETRRQLVVATVPDLQGYEIEEYGYRLGREWGIGEAGEDTGALLIVAPNERKVRIEVGYGLEGYLTDAWSSVTIQRTILPKFREGNMEGGIVAGVDAIIGQLALPPEEAAANLAAARAAPSGDVSGWPLGIVPTIFLIWFVFWMLRGTFGGRRYRRDGPWGGPIIIWGPGSGGSGGSWGGGSSGGFGGGFGGGGGSFGGGGASGSW